jgi:hypothetical protein
MRKIITLGLAFLLHSTTFAQGVPTVPNLQNGDVFELSKVIRCSSAESVLNFFVDKFQEKPLWVGKTSSGTHIVLLANKTTRTWTMVEYDSRLGCVIGAGEVSSNAEGI